MMVQFTQLFQDLLTKSGPSTFRSFSKSCRKMIAEGSMMPANTCTPRMINCSGAPGINTMAAASATQAM